jgi:hypothetical protein
MNGQGVQNPLINAAVAGMQQAPPPAPQGPIMPNAFQPKGAPGAVNGKQPMPKVEVLTSMVDQLNQIGSIFNNQGANDIAADCYEAAQKVNEILVKLQSLSQQGT